MHLHCGLWFAALLLIAACAQESIDFEEATIAGLHDRMQRGELSSEQLVSWYLDQI